MSFKKSVSVAGLVLAVAIIGLLIYLGGQAFFTFDSIREEVDRDQDTAETVVSEDWDENSRIFLLFGIDQEGGGVSHGRSDVIMVKAVNFETGEIASISIPRDTRAKIAGRSFEKIGHSFAYGTDTALETIENFTGLPIDHYIALNFDAFIKFIDMLGGLELYVERDIQVQDVEIEQGKQVLSGEETLSYVRFRNDQEGDFGRIRRQQQVIREVLDQSMNIRNAGNIMEILDITGENVVHDIPLSDVARIVRSLSGITADDYNSLFMLSIRGLLDDTWYAYITDFETKYIRNQMLEVLEK